LNHLESASESLLDAASDLRNANQDERAKGVDQMRGTVEELIQGLAAMLPEFKEAAGREAEIERKWRDFDYEHSV
jgi:hypothetical protein